MQGYNFTLKLLHWLIAIAVLLLIFVGLYMVNFANDGSKYVIYTMHKSVGFTVLVLLILRLFVGFFIKSPKLPKQFPTWERFAAKLMHYLLYIFAFLTAFSGYTMSYAGGRAVNLFFIYEVPSFISKNKWVANIAHSVHGVLPYILLGLIVIHLLAVAKHLLVDKINILKRIT